MNSFKLIKTTLKRHGKLSDPSSIQVNQNCLCVSVCQIEIGDQKIDNPKKVGETFNNFFANLGPNTEKSIPSNRNTRTIFEK